MGSRLTHLYLAHNRLAGIPQIVGILSVSSQRFYNLFPMTYGLLFHIADALSESNIIGSLERDHAGHITRCTPHWEVAAWLPEAKGPACDKLSYNAKHGINAGNCKIRISMFELCFKRKLLQMDSPGFPELEELSVAALTDESRIISDDHLQRILKSSSKLKLLDVRNCTRLTHESLIRLPAWDIKHLFLSGCSVTRDMGWV